MRGRTVDHVGRACSLCLLLGAAAFGCSDTDARQPAACVDDCSSRAGGDAGTAASDGSTAVGNDAAAGDGGPAGGQGDVGGVGGAGGAGGAGRDASAATDRDAAPEQDAAVPAPMVDVRPPGCGDGSCAGAESCDTCALDCAPCGTSTCGASASNCVTIDDTTQHQTMLGFEATAQAGQAIAGFDSYQDELFDRAANELLLNRLRVEVKSPSVNAGFDLGAVDGQMTQVALPLRAQLAARGERLWINVCVVGSHLKDNPQKYATEALRTVEHIEATYGIVPDSWEVALEPDVFGWDDGMLVGNALVAAGDLLSQNGYDLDFVAPSTTQARRAPTYADAMKDIPNIFDHWKELSYHRYDHPDAAELQAIAAKASDLGLRTSMLEHIDSGHADLFADLTEANVSVWQQYTLAFPAGSDDGAQYYWPQAGGSTLTLAARARYLRQYFAYVRYGSVRVGASSTRATLKPTAFITPDNRYVVVMNTAGNLSMDVAGLPAGTYGVTYTTATETHSAAADLTVIAGSGVSVAIPGSGVITVYGK